MKKNETIKHLLKRLEGDGLDFKDEQSGFVEDGKFWRADSLYKAVDEQKIKVTQYDLKYFNFRNNAMSCNRYDIFINHMSRVLLCDTNIPILISPEGLVVDGYHRILKRILIDKKMRIPCYVLNKMPDHDEERMNGKWVKV